MIKFRHTCILTNNLKQSLHFYRDLLGFKVIKEKKLSGLYPQSVLRIQNPKFIYVKLQAPNDDKNQIPFLELHYWLNPKMIIPKSVMHISLTIDDLKALYFRLAKERIEFLSIPTKAPDNNVYVCFCKDPDGNLIELVEEI
jgi:catechol 2,3-dioxygenase-like lactoylglutathione lyase family enzyme